MAILVFGCASSPEPGDASVAGDSGGATDAGAAGDSGAPAGDSGTPAGDAGTPADVGARLDVGVATPDSAVFALPEALLVTAETLALIPNVPKDADGGVILLEVGGTPMTLGPPRKDAIGAAAKCVDLLSACLIRTRDLDGCVAPLPACKTERPWEESAACCASARVSAYQEQRSLGASPLEAHDAVFGSDHECFPGRTALLQSVGGTPFLAPRRTR